MWYSVPAFFFFPWVISKDVSEAWLPLSCWFFSHQLCLLALLGRLSISSRSDQAAPWAPLLVLSQISSPASSYYFLGWEGGGWPRNSAGALEKTCPVTLSTQLQWEALSVMQALAVNPAPQVAATLSGGIGYSFLELVGSPQCVIITIVIYWEACNLHSAISLFYLL